MSEATLSSKGQITIPASIREFLGVNAQDQITFTPIPDGTVLLRAKTKSVSELRGMLTPKPGTKVSVDDMNMSTTGH